MPEKDVEELLGEPEAFDVWQENWESLQVFLTMRHQWRSAGMGGRTGLDLGALEIVMRRLKVKDEDRVWTDMMIMQDAALDEWAKQAQVK